jgi:hypothetical protein
VRRDPAKDIVAFLSFSGDHREPCKAIENFTRCDWEHAQRWLDDTGLAFYFLRKIKNNNSADILPPFVLQRLERNLASNAARIENMSYCFNEINQHFDKSAVRYEVVKGFSLIPEFCPNASLRHQADFDYLIDQQSLPSAQQVLLGVGYTPRESLSAKEFKFVHPGKEAARGDEQYSPLAAHAVELHTDIWDSQLHGLADLSKLFTVQQATLRQWNGFVFPSQTDEDAFLLQILHACRHLFAQWIRMSSLFEIGYFLNRRVSDTALWERVERRLQDRAVLRELVVIITELVARLFDAPVPPLIKIWGSRIRPAPRIWIDNYARTWAFGGLPAYQFSLFPRSKLVLFLQQQYKDPSAGAESSHRSWTASPRASRLASAIRSKPTLLFNAGLWREQLLLRRTIFFALAKARYICEIPRWWWLNRTPPSTSPER